MERLSGYGDPHALLCAEDHIVLKLETPWPPNTPLPEGFSPGDEDGRLLVMNRKALVAAKRALRGARISGAVFAGCAAFNSSDLFEDAAREVLQAAEEICIVHNRDTVCKLIRMFPRAKVLALPHDLVMHAVELEEPCRDRSAPLVEACELRELLGSFEDLYGDCLLLTLETTRAILATCPLVRRIDSPGVLEAFLSLGDAPLQHAHPKAKDFTRIVLLPSVGACFTGLEHFAGTADVALAARTFPHAEHFTVVVTSLESVGAISAFRHLRCLSVLLRPPICFVDVDLELQRLLKTLPRLESLSLEFCGGLRLAMITKLCPQIKNLRLVYCEGSNDENGLDENAFPNLEILELDAKLLRRTYYGLFGASARHLRILRLCSDSACLEFLRLSCLGGQGVCFPQLEELTLETNLTVSALELRPEDLHGALKALPALRHLKTDSYDLRLFFENYCAPRGCVSLSWCECVYCAVYDASRERRRGVATFVASHLR